MVNEKNKTEEKIKPVYKIHEGAIDGTIWANEREGSNGKFTSYNITIEKSFTRDDGQTWEKSKGFFAQDIDNVEKVVHGIKAYLVSQKARTSPKPRETTQ
jgi:hypothetical protein